MPSYLYHILQAPIFWLLDKLPSHVAKDIAFCQSCMRTMTKKMNEARKEWAERATGTKSVELFKSVAGGLRISWIRGLIWLARHVVRIDFLLNPIVITC